MEDGPHHSTARRRRRVVVVAVAVAAIVALLLRGRLHDAWIQASGTVEQSTGLGERHAFRLEDGSRVELNVGSMLRYPSEFPPNGRAVTLVGEGFFVVAKDSARPFTITAGPAVVQTTSGAFGVRAYPGENAARVIVDSGFVRVGPASSPGAPELLLSRAELARIARDGAIQRADSVDPGRHLGWRSGRIVFHDLPLRDALIELERWHDVDLGIGDSVVANRRVTATFQSHQTLTEILDGIALQLGARYDRTGRTVTFRLER